VFDTILHTLQNISGPELELFQNMMKESDLHWIDVTTVQRIIEVYGRFHIVKEQANLTQQNQGTECSIDYSGIFGSKESVFKWLESEPSYVSCLDVESGPGAMAAPTTLHSPPSHEGLSLPSSILPGLSPKGFFLGQY
jgi:hypothetical protein